MAQNSSNKTLKLLSNILFTLFMIIMIFLILITAQSKFTGQEPSLFGNRLYVVDSGSMEPTLPMNSIIVVKEKSAHDIKNGDILTYYGADLNTRVTHRVIEIGPDNDYFITQGDANNVEDSVPVVRENVIGTVSLTLPYLGYIFRFLSSTPGIIFIISIGIIAFISPILYKKISKSSSERVN